MNKHISLWIGDKYLPNSCSFARYVDFTFNIPWAPVTCHVRMKVEKMNDDFMNWVRKFADTNKINFPYIETFFNMLLYYCLKDEEVTGISNGFNINECILRARNNICEMMLKNKELMDEDSNLSGSKDVTNNEAQFSVCSVTKAPLLGFDGEMWLEPMEIDYDEKNMIIINDIG